MSIKSTSHLDSSNCMAAGPRSACWAMEHMLELPKKGLAPCSFPSPFFLPFSTSHLVGKDGSKSPGKFYEAPSLMSLISAN